MLSEIEIQEIKEHLNNARNPLFFYDNDVDGLCSFLLLSRFTGTGKGVAIKSFPELNETYARKLYELNPDYIFVLDKHNISPGFLEEAKKLNIPIVWIDHHDVEVDKKALEQVSYYNPIKKARGAEPVTYLCYQISKKKEDLWLALCGCISDNFFPDFVDEFSKQYPELIKKNVKTAFEILYETDIGKVARILSFALKDRTSNVVKMQKDLIKIKSPFEILKEDSKNQMFFRFEQVEKKYQDLIGRARKFSKAKLIYFQYGGELSLSADISNELSYRFPGKIIIVAYIKGTKANLSLRGKNVKEITKKAIEGLEDATGGGHYDATGAKLNVEDLPKFKEKIEELIK